MTIESEISAKLMEYVTNPIAEQYTEEIFEDLNYVLDAYIVEWAKKKGADQNDEDIVRSWERKYQDKIKKRRTSTQEQYGALLPSAFVASNLKLEFLIRYDHPAFQSGAIPEDVVEVMQEFIEIITYREEFEG